MKKILFALTACLIGIGATAGAASAQDICGPEGAPPNCVGGDPVLYPIPTTTVAQLPPPTTTTTVAIQPPVTLPTTGSNVSGAMRGGALLLVGGLVAVGVARRRRPADAA